MRREADEAKLKENLMSAMVEAALGGHELGEWREVSNGWQTNCTLCQGLTWMGKNGLRFSMLDDTCSGRKAEDA